MCGGMSLLLYNRRKGLKNHFSDFRNGTKGKEKTMPKLKTHRSGAKRYKVTASGKILRRKAGIGHLLQHKDGSRKRKIFKMCEISGTHFKLISKELPYKKYSR